MVSTRALLWLAITRGTTTLRLGREVRGDLARAPRPRARSRAPRRGRPRTPRTRASAPPRCRRWRAPRAAAARDPRAAIGPATGTAPSRPRGGRPEAPRRAPARWTPPPGGRVDPLIEDGEGRPQLGFDLRRAPSGTGSAARGRAAPRARREPPAPPHPRAATRTGRASRRGRAGGRRLRASRRASRTCRLSRAGVSRMRQRGEREPEQREDLHHAALAQAEMEPAGEASEGREGGEVARRLHSRP